MSAAVSLQSSAGASALAQPSASSAATDFVPGTESFGAVLATAMAAPTPAAKVEASAPDKSTKPAVVAVGPDAAATTAFASIDTGAAVTVEHTDGTTLSAAGQPGQAQIVVEKKSAGTTLDLAARAIALAVPSSVKQGGAGTTYVKGFSGAAVKSLVSAEKTAMPAEPSAPRLTMTVEPRVTSPAGEPEAKAAQAGTLEKQAKGTSPAANADAGAEAPGAAGSADGIALDPAAGWTLVNRAPVRGKPHGTETADVAPSVVATSASSPAAQAIAAASLMLATAPSIAAEAHRQVTASTADAAGDSRAVPDPRVALQGGAAAPSRVPGTRANPAKSGFRGAVGTAADVAIGSEPAVVSDAAGETDARVGAEPKQAQAGRADAKPFTAIVHPRLDVLVSDADPKVSKGASQQSALATPGVRVREVTIGAAPSDGRIGAPAKVSDGEPGASAGEAGTQTNADKNAQPSPAPDGKMANQAAPQTPTDAQPAGQDRVKRKADPAAASRPEAASVATPPAQAQAAAGRAVPISGGEKAEVASEARTPSEPATTTHTADRATLEVIDDQGNSTRIRVAVRGDQVTARILTPDPVSAGRMQGGLNDLQRALEGQGFSDARVTVQSTIASNERAAAGLGASSMAAETSGDTRGPETPTEDRRQGSGGRDLDQQADQRDGQQHGRPQDRHRRQRER